jgi:hypothetical protein
MFHHPHSPVVDHAAMRELQVSDAAFGAMRERVLGAFGQAAAIFCYGATDLVASARAVGANSRRDAPTGDRVTTEEGTDRGGRRRVGFSRNSRGVSGS